MRRQTIGRLSVACLALTVAILNASCSAGTRTSSLVRDDAGPGSSVELRAQDIYQRINGTPIQRAAGEFLITYAANHPTQTCMKELGFPYEWSYLNTWRDRTTSSGLDWTLLLGPLDTEVASISVREQALAWLALEDWQTQAQAFAARTEKLDGYDQALTDCQRRVPQLDETESHPHGWQQLYLAFQGSVAAVEGSDSGNPALELYEECMVTAGYPFATSYASLIGGLIDRSPRPEDVPHLGGPLDGHPSWQRLLDLEAAALEADSQCRSSQYASLVADLGIALTEFEQEKGDAVDALSRAWDTKVDEAASLGWDPTLLVSSFE